MYSKDLWQTNNWESLMRGLVTFKSKIPVDLSAINMQSLKTGSLSRVSQERYYSMHCCMSRWSPAEVAVYQCSVITARTRI